MPINYGYVRVSTADQNEARQLDAMREVGVTEDHIYIDKQSGKDFNRKAYRKLLRKMKEGDVLFIKSIDRLGRNYDEIQIQWGELKKKKVDVVVMDMPLLDTRQQIQGVTGRFMADIVLQILSYVAHIERDNLRQRQAEGIKSAHERGVQFGRPRNEVPEDFAYMCEMVNKKKISGHKAARQLGIPKTTFFRKLNEYNNSVLITDHTGKKSNHRRSNIITKVHV